MIICLSCRLDKKDCCKVLGPFLLLNAAEVTLSSALETKCPSPGFVFRKKLRPFKETRRQCSGWWWQWFCHSEPFVCTFKVSVQLVQLINPSWSFSTLLILGCINAWQSISTIFGNWLLICQCVLYFIIRYEQSASLGILYPIWSKLMETSVFPLVSSLRVFAGKSSVLRPRATWSDTHLNTTNTSATSNSSHTSLIQLMQLIQGKLVVELM